MTTEERFARVFYLGQLVDVLAYKVQRSPKFRPLADMTGLDFIREKVRIRDNHTCQECGKKWIPGQRRLDVHHLEVEMESVRSYRYDRDNQHKLITLCHKCHLRLPHNLEKMQKAKEFIHRVI